MFEPVRNSQCRGCPLWEQCLTVCLKTEQYNHEMMTWDAPTKDRAVLIIGEAPGRDEDIHGVPFIGAAGTILRKLFIDHHELPSLVDVYITNSVRCRPPGNKTPTKGQLTACQGYYLEDLLRLQGAYSEVFVLAVGGAAVSSVLGLSLRKSFVRQGAFTDFRILTSKTNKARKVVEERLEMLGASDIAVPLAAGRWPEPCRVFTTYHPIYLRREPSVAPAVSSHLRYLKDFLTGDLHHELTGPLDIDVAPRVPDDPMSRIVLDIETYGFAKHLPNQTQFHPLKSEVWDRVAPHEQILTVGLTYTMAIDGSKHHAIFVMAEAQHRKRLWGFLRTLTDNGVGYGTGFALGGHNLAFDIAYLRHCWPQSKLYLNPDVRLIDTMILNYLNDEGRPEKSLKALSQVYRITQYDTEHERLYVDGHDPALHQYNCQDTAATDLLIDKFRSEIAHYYGADSPKLSDYSQRWYSDLLWLVIQQNEVGIGMDTTKLGALLTLAESEREGILLDSYCDFAHTLKGKGSEKSKRRIMSDCVDALVEADTPLPDLARTESKGLVKFDEENRNLLMPLLEGGLAKEALVLLGRFQDVSGLLDRYLYPLLEGRGKNHGDPSTRIIKGVVYPRWFPVPSEWDDGSAGGTKQARIVAKGPAVQTFPPKVKKCIRSRFGCEFIWADYSQIELRVAGLLSGDPVMIQEYRDGIDRHINSALRLFGPDAQKHPNWLTDYRQGGKVANFLQLFLGEAPKLQSSMTKDLGITLDLVTCQKFILAERMRYKVLHKWQMDLLDFVNKHEYYELPVLGQSRMFLGGKYARKRARSEIVNLPVQAEAANIMLSAQIEILRQFRRRSLRSLCGINIYDAVGIEVAPYEMTPVTQVLAEVLPNPPYFQTLCHHLGRTIPIQAEVTVLRSDGTEQEKYVL